MSNDIHVLKPAKKRTRHTLDLPEIFNAGVHALTLEYGTTTAEVMRDAAKLLIEFNKLKKRAISLAVGKREKTDYERPFVFPSKFEEFATP
jgi:hypothetical protein